MQNKMLAAHLTSLFKTKKLLIRFCIVMPKTINEKIVSDQ